MHPPPAFGLSPSTELALGTNKLHVQDGNSALTSLLLEIGLNIEEAHAFFTKDGYSMDVFVVDGWEMRFKGSFHNQEVAIKVLKVECLNEDVQRDFAQEIYILRKVRHKNVVQFIETGTYRWMAPEVDCHDPNRGPGRYEHPESFKDRAPF
ncbi:hypothetical protein BC332_02278 [Capsicum chinense]|nr:hypothetical protein BC332_02278 [Capsicum chinense]